MQTNAKSLPQTAIVHAVSIDTSNTRMQTHSSEFARAENPVARQRSSLAT